jgi:hypothetical protein
MVFNISHLIFTFNANFTQSPKVDVDCLIVDLIQVVVEL